MMTAATEQRQVQFASIDEIVPEAERLASMEVRTSGRHGFPEILRHVALAFEASCGRLTPPPAPLFMRLMRPLIRLMVLRKQPLKPGIRLPPKGEEFFWPADPIDTPAALQMLREAVEHYRQTDPLPRHPFFGPMTREQADSLNCRHAALHFSFVHPAESD